MHHSSFAPRSVVKQVRTGPILMPLGSHQLVGAEYAIRCREQGVFSIVCANKNMGNREQQRGKCPQAGRSSPSPTGFCRYPTQGYRQN